MDLEPTPTSLRILIVDDEPPVLQVLEEFLRMEGHEPSIASDGAEALALFHGGNWDLVLTDRMMPGLSGDDLALAIKEAQPAVPVIMITGFVDPQTDYLAAPRTIDVVVRKPFTFAAIRNAIAEARAACSQQVQSAAPRS